MSAPQVRIFIAGTQSGAGKSTACLGLLGALLHVGYKPEELAYMKPATQGVQQTLTAKFCASKGIACRHVGPLVFYRGFTKLFLQHSGTTIKNKKGEDEYIPTTAEIQRSIKEEVDEVAAGKKVVILDGVGYPGVGSLVGCSNADVAKVTNACALLIGKPGLGDCIDSFCECSTFFESAQVKVLGMIVNRVTDGKEKTSMVPTYFEKYQPDKKLYGILTENESMVADHDGYAPPGEHNACFITRGSRNEKQLRADPCDDKELVLCEKLVAGFLECVPLERVREIVADAAK